MTTEHPIHVTSRQQFKSCRRLYYFSNVLGLVPKKPVYDGRFFGQIGHETLAEIYQSDVPLSEREYTAVVDRHLESTPSDWDQVELARSVLLSYFEQYREDIDRFNILGVEREHHVKVETTEGVATLCATADVLFECRQTGRIFQMDHKFYASETTEERVAFDDQFTSYHWVLSQIYDYSRVGGIIVNLLYKRQTKPPTLLKSGKRLSVDRTQTTTAELVETAIAEHGFERSDYSDYLAYLEQNPVKLRERFTTKRSRTHLRLYQQDLVAELTDMISSSIAYYPNPGYDCYRCEFCRPCRQLTETGDCRDLLKREYLQSGEV